MSCFQYFYHACFETSNLKIFDYHLLYISYRQYIIKLFALYVFLWWQVNMTTDSQSVTYFPVNPP